MTTGIILINKLQDKVNEDLKKFKANEINKGVEAVFSNAYHIAIAQEWQNFFEEGLQNFLDNMNNHERAKAVCDVLLSLDNIINELIRHCGYMDYVELSQQAFEDYFWGYLHCVHKL